MFAESRDNFITKWDGYRERIIEVRKKTSPAIANMIDAFEETDSSKLNQYSYHISKFSLYAFFQLTNQ